ncbi:MAG TPA: hypothetical protein VJB35_02520 [Candidatus Nanoarchaeia archaeon]|nr:hypothetical protein [Candidatus Nanoarchaeia archaeon]
MINEHKSNGKIRIDVFFKKVKAYTAKNIEFTFHSNFRLSEKQRKIYTQEEIVRIIFNLKPKEIIKQKNGNLAVIYNYKNKYLKILLDLTINKIYIVTFFFLNIKQSIGIQNNETIK